MRCLPLLAALLSVSGLGLSWRAAVPVKLSPQQRRREQAAVPDGFVYVPGGWCWIGSDDPDADPDARPRRRVHVPSFYIGKHEVTQVEWKRFQPGHRIPPGCESFPVTNVLRSEAEAYCRWAGGRLPSDVEWEKAARGVDGRRYPWGDRFEPHRVNLARRRTTDERSCSIWMQQRGLRAVTAHPEGASPYEALQMAGNAWEWVAGCVDGDPQKGIIRGGAVSYNERDGRTYHRGIEGSGAT